MKSTGVRVSYPDTVYIREVGPREGFQVLRKSYSASEKVRLIDALSETGVREIEVVSFVSPTWLPQMADAEEVVQQMRKKEGVRYTGLCLNSRGFERAELTGRLDNSGWVYASSSETFLKKNANTSVDNLVADLPEQVELLRRFKKKLFGLMISMAFGCPDEGPVDVDRLLAVIGKFVDGAERLEGTSFQEVCLADTVGLAHPESIKRVVASIRQRFPGINVSLHLHDTRGTGLVNAYAGLQEGVSTFEASVGGLGGCPFAVGAAGNIATEELVYLCELLGVATHVDLDRYIAAAKIAEEIVGGPLPGRLYRSRPDAC